MTPRTDKLYEEVWRFTNETDAVDALISMRDFCRELERENAALREDKERLEWLERYHLSLSRLTSPDMSGLRFVGQCFNPAKERGEGGPSYLKIEGSTIRAAIDAARKEAQP